MPVAGPALENLVRGDPGPRQEEVSCHQRAAEPGRVEPCRAHHAWLTGAWHSSLAGKVVRYQSRNEARRGAVVAVVAVAAVVAGYDETPVVAGIAAPRKQYLYR